VTEALASVVLPVALLLAVGPDCEQTIIDYDARVLVDGLVRVDGQQPQLRLSGTLYAGDSKVTDGYFPRGGSGMVQPGEPFSVLMAFAWGGNGCGSTNVGRLKIRLQLHNDDLSCLLEEVEVSAPGTRVHLSEIWLDQLACE
jgi:hypothetical protein